MHGLVQVGVFFGVVGLLFGVYILTFVLAGLSPALLLSLILTIVVVVGMAKLPDFLLKKLSSAPTFKKLYYLLEFFGVYFWGLGVFLGSMVVPVLALAYAVFTGDYSNEREMKELGQIMLIGSGIGAFLGIFVGIIFMGISSKKIEPKIKAVVEKCLANINFNAECVLLVVNFDTLAIDYTNNNMLIYTKGKEIRLKPEDIKGVIDGSGSKTMTDTPLGLGSTSWSHAEIHTKLPKHPKIKINFNPKDPFEQQEAREAIKKFCDQDAKFFNERVDVTFS